MPLEPEVLSRVYGRHPARAMAFDELYEGLAREVAAGNVVRTSDGGLELFLYSTRCIYDRGWNLFSMISRGLVLDPGARRVVATPFPKFFNYGEVVTAVPDLPFEVTEKVDGSLVVVFRHGGRWRATTKGAFESEQAAWATRYLNERLEPAGLDQDTTYLCEAVYRENRIVVPYAFEGLVLLSAYDAGGDELDRPRLAEAAAASGMRLVEAHAYDSLDGLVATTRALGLDREGFVVRFTNGMRLKLKGEEYLRVHRTMSQCGPLAVWEAMLGGTDLDAVRRDLPEEMLSDFDSIRRLLNARLEALVNEILAAAERVKALSDRELGLLLKEPGHGMSEFARDFVFACRKCDFRAAAASSGRVRDGLLRRIRPDGNRLEGYIPSSAATRFRIEST